MDPKMCPLPIPLPQQNHDNPMMQGQQFPLLDSSIQPRTPEFFVPRIPFSSSYPMLCIPGMVHGFEQSPPILQARGQAIMDYKIAPQLYPIPMGISPPYFGGGPRVEEKQHPDYDGLFDGHTEPTSVQSGHADEAISEDPSQKYQRHVWKLPGDQSPTDGTSRSGQIGPVLMNVNEKQVDQLTAYKLGAELILGPPMYHQGPPSSQEGEIFVGLIPKNVTDVEKDIYYLFSQIGPIYQLRLMTNFSGHNKGYCFIQYYNYRDAERAVLELNGHQLHESSFRSIRVEKSKNNTRLFFKGVPTNLNAIDIFNIITQKLDFVDLVGVDCPPLDPTNVKQPYFNRGFCYLQFGNHRSAIISRKIFLQSPGLLFGGTGVIVDWAKPYKKYQAEDLI